MKTPNTLANKKQQHGAALVEFGLVCLIFLTLVLGIVEVGRMLYLYNTMQEVTRRVAREAVVRWVSDAPAIKTAALFGASSLPGAPELTTSNIVISYRNGADRVVANVPLDAGDNLSACNDVLRTEDCITSVSVSLENVNFVPLVSLLGFTGFTMPYATVTMPAESLGFNN